MAEATIEIELKGDTNVELRIAGDNLTPRTERWEFASRAEAEAGMKRAFEYVRDLLQAKQVNTTITKTQTAASVVGEDYGKGEGFLL